jgi:hypothetical protein
MAALRANRRTAGPGIPSAQGAESALIPAVAARQISGGTGTSSGTSVTATHFARTAARVLWYSRRYI